jgi:hypothetical protein
MSLVRPWGSDNGVISRRVMPGDILGLGESLSAGAISTAGNGTWTAAAIATGIINRTGPTGAYTDTTDTAANILSAIAGSAAYNGAAYPDVVPGTSFRLICKNTVAFAQTFATGTGVVAGATASTLNGTASAVREYLFTVLNTTPVQQWQMTGNSGYATLYFGYTVGASGAAPGVLTTIPYVGSNGAATPGQATITPGATVSGTNVAASATVIGLIMGVGGIIGVTVSGNNTGAVNGPITFGPTVQVDSLGSWSL